MEILDIITLLIVLAAGFSYVNMRFLKLPATIALMIMALTLSVMLVLLGYAIPSLKEEAVSFVGAIDFSELLLDVMLGLLLFAGALHVDLGKLREWLGPISLLATVGILITTGLIGTAMYYLLPLLGLELSFIYCLLFGALISPTDPIAVLALLKKLSVPKSLEIKIAGESLFNDGVGVVIFLTLLDIAKEGPAHVEAGQVALLFVQEVAGGLLLGGAIGFLGFHLLRIIDTEHAELELLVTLAMVLGGMRLAHMLHVSGPLAMVITGLFIGNEGRGAEYKDVKNELVNKFWYLIDEVLNAMLFILIGLEVLVITFRIDYLLAGLLAMVITVGARFAGVGLPISILKRFRKFEPRTVRILSWGGLRGGISVALAFTLPEGSEKELITTITYTVVVLSILLQGLTIGKVIGKSAEE